MTSTVDVRPPGFSFWYRPGVARSIVVTFPDGTTAGHDFVAYFDAADTDSLDSSLADDVLTIDVSAAATTAHPSVPVNFVIRRDDEDYIIGTGTPSMRAATSSAHEVTVTDGTISIAVTVLGGIVNEGDGGSFDGDASDVPFTPHGNLSSDNVQDALEELDSEKAPTVHTHTLSQISDAGTAASRAATDFDPANAASDAQAAAEAHADGLVDGLSTADFETTGDGTLGITSSVPRVGWGVETGGNNNAHGEVTSPVGGVAYFDFTVVDVDARARLYYDDTTGEFGILLDSGHSLVLHADGTVTAGGTGLATSSAVATAISAAIAGLVDSAPGALDTLNELAAALGDDADFAGTVTNALALKAPLASPAFTGTPTAPTQSAGDGSTKLATTAYADGAASSAAAGKVSDTAYDATSWDGDTTHAPSKNAVRDKLQTLAPLASPVLTGTPTVPGYLPLAAGGASVEDVGAIESNVNTVAATGSTEALDTSLFAVHDCTMDQACTFTFTNPAPSGKNTTFMLILRGAFTPTLPASVDWGDATPPTYSTPSVYVFSTVDAGTTWLGALVGKAFG